MIEWAGLSHGDSARLFQAVGAVTVIFVGGVFAYWRLQIFRTFQPHLTITHEVSHRFVGDSYVHIAVTANLRNSSRVSVEIRRFTFRLQEVAPASDSEEENVMTSKTISSRTVRIIGTSPRKAPPKADNSGKPPGSTLNKNKDGSSRKS